MTPRNDRGSASIWVLACTALLLVVVATVALRASATLARHRAEFSADAAALAAAGQIGLGSQPCAAAVAIAAENGATVSDCRVDLAENGRSGQVTVTVTAAARLPILGTETVFASAKAARDPP